MGMEPAVPQASWHTLSCDGGILRGISSIRGPFEISVEDVLAVGQHVRFPDGTSPLLPDIDCWIGVLTREEYGLVHEVQPEYSDLAKWLSESLGIDASVGGWAWQGWNEARGCDSRFIYPPWVFGFSVYEWSQEGRSRWRSFVSQHTGFYGYKEVEGVLGPTVPWLVEGEANKERKRWSEFTRSPPPAVGLGPQRFVHRWQAPYRIWWLTGLVACALVGLGAVFWQDLSGSLTGRLAIAVIALAASTVLWPRLFAATMLHDHGLTTRRWYVNSKKCSYDEIREIHRDKTGLKFYPSAGAKLHHPAALGDPALVELEIQDLTDRSLAIRYAQGMGVPFRLPETRPWPADSAKP